jgi:hypothetical protein
MSETAANFSLIHSWCHDGVWSAEVSQATTSGTKSGFGIAATWLEAVNNAIKNLNQKSA